ncbi:MAG TPA: RNA-binding cell elongation regulator Jag/EloR [bacterium]|nr:RNA-binding cell elongation regulator Jag/EloR [bacterium]
MKHAEGTGRTVEEATERALMQLGASHEDVDVEVLDAGTRGVLGLGARDARVRVTLREGAAAAAHRLADRLLQVMGFATTVRAREAADTVTVEVRGQDLGALIGRRGGTLEAVELLLGAMVAKETGLRSRIILDVEGYWERRSAYLEKLARQTAERVQRDGRRILLAPMPARERRVIHSLLADHPAVMTFSQGEGLERRVIVAPRTAKTHPTEPGPL